MKKEIETQEESLLSFLKQTKEGKYAKIDENSLDYARIKESREDEDALTETFYYSLS